MKANELQIGDWVKIKTYGVSDKYERTEAYIYVKLAEIGSGLITVEYNNDIKEPYRICENTEIEPIPLIPEILEKNGFEVQDQGGGRKDVWTGFGIDYEGDIEVEFQYNIPIYLKIDGGFKGEYYTSANIKFVHQLQHAFKLCGIEKEIEL